MNKIKKIFSSDLISKYLIINFVFIISSIAIKIVETIIVINENIPLSFSEILISFFNIIASFSLYSTIIFIIYFIIFCLHKKTAIIITATLYSLITLFEIGLMIYSFSTGSLMGNELIIRPFNEIYHTIIASSNTIINIILIIIIFSIYFVISFLLCSKKINKKFSIFYGCIILLFSVSSFFIQSLNKKIDQTNQKTLNYIIPKCYFFSSSVFNNFNTDKIFNIKSDNREEINYEYLKEFETIYPEIHTENYIFPFERKSENIADILSPFFKDCDTTPDIVIIIMESLGREFACDIEDGKSFTPFLDSLKEESLYWENCLSVALRTYAAVPAITASVPHGNKGFQFGEMPNSLSIIKILNQNNYYTSFLYGGDVEFDNMLNYLNKENIKYISNDYYDPNEFKKNNRKATAWGLRDSALFSMATQHISKISEPQLNIILTLSNHDAINPKETRDTFLLNEYLPKAKKIANSFSEGKQKVFQDLLYRICPLMYSDDCVKNFIENYKKNNKFKNTIFIITGDHASGAVTKNSLSYYHVPLIIYSPLLKKAKKMKSVVSHNDIAVSLIALLQNKYNLKSDSKLSWFGTGLDSLSNFNSNKKILILDYDRCIREMIYNNYYYRSSTSFREKKLYIINDYLETTEINDSVIMNNLENKFNILSYCNKYAYNNNCITTNGSKIVYQPFLSQEVDSLAYFYDENINYGNLEKYHHTIFNKKINIKNINSLKINIKGEIAFPDSLYFDNYPYLNIEYSDKNNNIIGKMSEYISILLKEDKISYKDKNRISYNYIIKNISTDEIYLKIFLSPPRWDDKWQPNTKIILTDTKIEISKENE